MKRSPPLFAFELFIFVKARGLIESGPSSKSGQPIYGRHIIIAACLGTRHRPYLVSSRRPVGMAPLSRPEVLPSAAASQVLSLTVAHALQSAGFKSAPNHLLLTLTTVVEKYLDLLATTSDDLAESTGRRRAAVVDVLDALEELTGDGEEDLLEWVDGRGLAGNSSRKEAKVVYEGLSDLKGEP